DPYRSRASNMRSGIGSVTFHSCNNRERLLCPCNPSRPLFDAPPTENPLTCQNSTTLACVTRKIPVLVSRGRSSHDERGETLVKKQSRPTMAPDHPVTTVI